MFFISFFALPMKAEKIFRYEAIISVKINKYFAILLEYRLYLQNRSDLAFFVSSKEYPARFRQFLTTLT